MKSKHGVLGIETVEGIVQVSKIDLQDEDFQFRDTNSLPCQPDDFVVQDGVTDLSGEHPVILQHVEGEKYLIVSGFGRLTVLSQNAEVKEVKCQIVNDTPEEDIVIAASRVNLTHGKPLTISEKKRCFEKEKQALEASNTEIPSKTELARVYQVSRTTIYNWLSDEGKSDSGAENEKQKSIQNGHSGSVATTSANDDADEMGAKESKNTSSELVCNSNRPGELVHKLAAQVNLVTGVDCTDHFTEDHINDLEDQLRQLTVFITKLRQAKEA